MDVKQYKCPNCDAELKFNPDKQKFCCEFCLSEFTTQQVNEMLSQKREKADDQKKNEQKAQQEPKPQSAEEARRMKQQKEFEESTRLYSCPSCGAEIVSDMNTAASFCYYCHNPVILKGRVEGIYQPSKVIPFAFGRDKAVEIFNDWAKDKKYLPDDLISSKQIEKMTGLYVPFWVADAHTVSHFDAIGENVRTWVSGDYDYTQVKEYQVIRDLGAEYRGVPADGSKKIEDSIMEAIEPFNYNELKDFDMAYLSGFFADKYDVDKESVQPRILKRMFDNNHSDIMGSCSYTTMKNKHFGDNIKQMRWNYFLLPVWFMTFHYKGKVWEYAINGQTGKISGELPIDNKKMFRSQFIACLITLIVTLGIGYLFGGLLL